MIQSKLERLLPLLEQGSRDPSTPPSVQWRQALDEFVHLATTISPVEWRRFTADYPDILLWRPRIAPCYGAYIKSQEVSSASCLLERIANQSRNGKATLPAGFAQRAYDRVADLFDRVDFASCRRLVMVGCGPLPVTLLHIADRTDISELVGLDADDHAIELANRMIDVFAKTQISARYSDGRDCSYADADIVYVANLVTPKAFVLQQIADTIRPGATIIVREPYCVGELLAENATSELDPRFQVVGEAGEDGHFLSRHVYLRRHG